MARWDIDSSISDSWEGVSLALKPCMTWLYEYNNSSLSSAGDDNNDFRMERCHDSWVKKDVGLWVWSICMMYVLNSSDLGTALTIASRNSSSPSSEHCEIRWEKLIFMVIVLMGYRVRKQWEWKGLYIIPYERKILRG